MCSSSCVYGMAYTYVRMPQSIGKHLENMERMRMIAYRHMWKDNERTKGQITLIMSTGEHRTITHHLLCSISQEPTLAATAPANQSASIALCRISHMFHSKHRHICSYMGEWNCLSGRVFLSSFC